MSGHIVPVLRAVLHSCLRTDRQLTFEFCTGTDEVSYLSLLLVSPCRKPFRPEEAQFTLGFEHPEVWPPLRS